MIPKLVKCNNCKQDIDSKAKVCYHCNRFQSKCRELLRAYTTNALSIFVLGLAIIQLILAAQEKSKAETAAERANNALSQIQSIKKEIEQKDSIMRILTKASYENTVIGLTRTLDVSDKNELGDKILSDNDSLIFRILEPDNAKRGEWNYRLEQATK